MCFAWDLILLEEEGGDFLPYKSVTAVQSASICGKVGQTRFPGNLRTYFLYFAEELGRRNSFQPATKCLFELHNFPQSNLLSSELLVTNFAKNLHQINSDSRFIFYQFISQLILQVAENSNKVEWHKVCVILHHKRCLCFLSPESVFL